MEVTCLQSLHPFMNLLTLNFAKTTLFKSHSSEKDGGAHGEQLTLLALRMPTGLKEKTPASKKASHVSEDDFLFSRFMVL